MMTSASFPLRRRARAAAVRLLVGTAPLLALAGCPDVPQTPPTKVVVAEFDPLATPPVVPTPTDLALVGGHPQFPDAPNASPAQKELNAYIRSLDGFPPESPATAFFSAPLDPATVTAATATAGAVMVLDVTAQTLLGPTQITVAPSPDGTRLAVTPGTPASPAAWSLGHTYAVVLFGGDDPAGLKGQGGLPVAAAPLVYFARGTRPLLQLCPLSLPPPDGGVPLFDDDDGGVDDVDGGLQDDDAGAAVDSCACPYDADDDAFDPRCVPSTSGLDLQQALQLERLRLHSAPLLAQALALGGPSRKRSDIVLFWSFTIAHGPFAVFDPTRALVAFPNDVLIDQMTGLVHLPIDPKASPTQQAIYMGLDTLDGFSTTASETVPIATADDSSGAPPKGVVAGTSALLIDATHPGKQPTYDAAPRLVNGGKDFVGTAAPGVGLLALTPVRPLYPDREQYVGVLTDGITDASGRPLRPSTVERLVMSQAPLYDTATKKSLVDVLSDGNAAQLEQLRAAYAQAGLFDQLQALLGLTRDHLAMVWTFTTQTETTPLLALAAYPTTKALPTDVTILDVEPGTAYGADVGSIVFGRLHTHVALSPTTGLLDLAGGADVDVPFVLLTPAVEPAGGAPVAIVQHGLSGWRGDVRFLAEAFAQKGYAVLGIDIDFHGARTRCAADADCSAGGKCTTSGAMAGTCSTALAPSPCTSDAECASGSCTTTTGACAGGLAKASDLCMTHQEGGSPVTECKPAASGKGFLDLSNPFATRDHLRQHVLDLSQVVRVVEDASPTGLQAQLAAQAPTAIHLDTSTSKLAYLGVSLGGIEGSLFLSVAPQPTVGVLNVPGGKLVDLFVNSPTFGKLLTPLLTANGVAPDTQPYYQLLDVFRWIIDPADPVNFGRYIDRETFGSNASKAVIVQEAGADMVIPNPETDALAVEIGLPFVAGHPGVDAPLASMPQAGPMDVSTYFPGAAHGFLFGNDPETASGRQQATTWIASGGTLVTAP